jgi:D-aminoacyl-tRNA deacylase
LRVVVQKVSGGEVNIPNENYQQKIDKGLVILLGIKTGDTEKDVNFLADKCGNLRIFADENEKMNLSVKDINGEALIISQFTLYGDASRGNRPGYTEAANPREAIPLYKKFIEKMKNNIGGERVKTGIFGAMMEVQIINDGPVTIIIDSK